MTDPLGGLTDIIRRHHETGAYAGCIIRVHPTALDAIRNNSAPAPERPTWQPDMDRFHRLDLITDPDLPEGGWEVRRVQYRGESRTEVLVAKGTVGLLTVETNPPGATVRTIEDEHGNAIVVTQWAMNSGPVDMSAYGMKEDR